ncbi:MAG: universal stress protein [Haloferacaceae archaeon]
MYETILVPTDGSKVAEHAVDHALELAETYGGTVHALYVVDTDAMEVSLNAEQVDRIDDGEFGELDELEEFAERATEIVTERAADRGVDVVERVVGGNPHESIAEYAEENGVDVIVMGSHGRSGIRRALLGSVTERVLRTTTVPVLVVDGKNGKD